MLVLLRCCRKKDLSTERLLIAPSGSAPNGFTHSVEGIAVLSNEDHSRGRRMVICRCYNDNNIATTWGVYRCAATAAPSANPEDPEAVLLRARAFRDAINRLNSSLTTVLGADEDYRYREWICCSDGSEWMLLRQNQLAIEETESYLIVGIPPKSETLNLPSGGYQFPREDIQSLQVVKESEEEVIDENILPQLGGISRVGPLPVAIVQE